MTPHSRLSRTISDEYGAVTEEFTQAAAQQALLGIEGSLLWLLDHAREVGRREGYRAGQDAVHAEVAESTDAGILVYNRNGD